jgi:hypothetical protein
LRVINRDSGFGSPVLDIKAPTTLIGGRVQVSTPGIVGYGLISAVQASASLGLVVGSDESYTGFILVQDNSVRVNQPFTASIVSASFIGNLTGNATTSTSATSASYAVSSSHALNVGLVLGEGTNSLVSRLTSTPAVATGTSNIAIGNSAQSFGPRNIVIGGSANTDLNTQNSIVIGLSASIAMNHGVSPVHSIAIGHLATVGHTDSISIGYNAQTSAEKSLALGYSSNASALNSTAIGRLANATGNNSVAIGNADATAVNAYALGEGANASNTNTTAIGVAANATGDESIALGVSSQASGENSTIVGRRGTASGARSISIGSLTEATAADTIAIGASAQATTGSAIALGANIIANVPSYTTTRFLQLLNVSSSMGAFGFVDDTAAASGGVPLGGIYHLSGSIKIRMV